MNGSELGDRHTHKPDGLKLGGDGDMAVIGGKLRLSICCYVPNPEFSSDCPEFCKRTCHGNWSTKKSNRMLTKFSISSYSPEVPTFGILLATSTKVFSLIIFKTL